MKKRSDFKVGDHVIVVSGKHIGNWAVSTMDKHVGKKAVITRITDGLIRIDIDKEFNNWSASLGPEAYVDFDPDMLIETAKKRYPIGTRYICTESKTDRKVLQGNFSIPTPGLVWGDPGEGILFQDGKWAEIIEDPVLKLLGSQVKFHGPKGIVTYTVENNFLNAHGDTSNYKIFQDLGLYNQKEQIAEEAYGYRPEGGDWPSYRHNDFEAAQRLIEKLHQLCADAKKDPEEASKDEFLQELLVRYPVGTTFIAVECGQTCTVQKDWKIAPASDTFSAWFVNELGVSAHDGYLYYNGRYAEKINKFKVGDKVIGNDKADSSYSITRKGTKGTVIEVTSDTIIKIHAKGDEFSVSADCFDLLSETYDLKVGDVVGIKNDSDYVAQGMYRGQYMSGIVTEVRKDHDHCYRVKWADRDENVYRPEDLIRWTGPLTKIIHADDLPVMQTQVAPVREFSMRKPTSIKQLPFTRI